jgi:hypothetical protein
MRMQPCQHGSSGWAAAGCVIELRKPQAVTCKPVQIRGLHFSAVAANIRVAHVIIQDEDYIRFLVSIHIFFTSRVPIPDIYEV